MKYSAWALSALMAGSIALAQPPGPPRPPGPPVERMAADLGLDDYQTGELKRIFAAQRAKMDAERRRFEASGTRPTHEQMEAGRAEREADIRLQLSGILNAEQLAKFDRMMKDRPRRGPPGPPPGAEHSNE